MLVQYFCSSVNWSNVRLPFKQVLLGYIDGRLLSKHSCGHAFTVVLQLEFITFLLSPVLHFWAHSGWLVLFMVHWTEKSKPLLCLTRLNSAESAFPFQGSCFSSCSVSCSVLSAVSANDTIQGFSVFHCILGHSCDNGQIIWGMMNHSLV